MQNSTDDIFMFVQHRSYFILHINFKRSETILFLQKHSQQGYYRPRTPFWFVLESIVKLKLIGTVRECATRLRCMWTKV